MSGFWSRLGVAWCRLAHPAPLWPRHGYYQCPRCSRLYTVPWETVGQSKVPKESGPAVNRT